MTVFERADRIGGLLVYGIPNMKLDKNVVQRRVDLMTAEGVGFVTTPRWARICRPQSSGSEFDAVVLCGGATKPRDLDVEGRQLKGDALRRGFPARRHAQPARRRSGGRAWISARHKDVVVIGGGDTGTDCVGTAIRHGCAGLVQLEILPQPPDTRPADNPWPQWPKTYRTDYGQEEATESWATIRASSRAHEAVGRRRERPVREVQTVRVEWEQTNGRPTSARAAGHRGALAGAAGAAGDGLPGAGEHAAGAVRRRAGRAGRTCRPSTGSSPRTSPASSRPATCAAGRAWSCGRSTRAGAQPASAIAT